MHRHVEDHRRHAMLQPIVIDVDQAIAAREDEIDEMPVVSRFAQPMTEHQLTVDPVWGERFVDTRPIRSPDEQIEIFGIAHEGGVMLEGIRAANERRDASLAQVPQDGSIHFRSADIVGCMEDCFAHGKANAKPVPKRSIE